MSENRNKAKSHLEVIATSKTDEKYLTFWTGKQLIGMPLNSVMRVIQMRPMVSAPHSSIYCQGSVKIDNDIIPVVDLSLFLGYEGNQNNQTCIVICRFQNRKCAFAVENVTEVSDIPKGSISPLPLSQNNPSHYYVIGISQVEVDNRKEIILLIDPKKILQSLS